MDPWHSASILSTISELQVGEIEGDRGMPGRLHICSDPGSAYRKGEEMKAGLGGRWRYSWLDTEGRGGACP